jgi:hypothetical protein
LTGTSTEFSSRQYAWGVAAVALAGWLLRASPLAGDGGAWAVRVDYDEGVYFSAASLLLRGLLPYRDFVFVHPPGFLLLLAPIAKLGAHGAIAAAFATARWLATLVGVANIVLCAAVARRASGPIGGLVAASLYALYPEAAAVERGVFLEPVLNLACLGMAAAWLSSGRANPLPPAGEGPGEGRQRWVWIAGALAGAALAIKLWGGIWVLAAFAAVPSERRARAVSRFVLAGAIAFALALIPFAAKAPHEFLADAVSFQLQRPADHLANRISRIGEVFSHRHAAAWLLGLLGLSRVVTRLRTTSPGERLAAVAYVLTLAAFFAAKAFWSQYDAFLAPAEVVLAGAGAAWLWEVARSATPFGQIGVGVLLLAAIAFGAAKVSQVNKNAQDGSLRGAAEALRQVAPKDACFFALEPAWGIAADRLPERIDASAPWVDPYGRMLIEAARSGVRAADVETAFQAPASQASLRGALASCRYAALGGRARWQLSRETWDWINAHWTRRYDGEPDIWERSSP